MTTPTAHAAPVSARPPAATSFRGRLRRGSTPYLFMTPFSILFLLFFIVPILYAFKLSLFTVQIHRAIGHSTQTTSFDPLANYQQAVGDADFWNGVKNMVGFGVIQVPVMLGLALLFALLLDSPYVRLKPFFRLSFFVPFAIPSVVAALIWGYFYTPSLSPLSGLASSINFFQPASHLLAAVGNIVTWEWAGYNMVILIAALQSISTDIYEAAGLDGCGPIRTALYVKAPLLRPALVLTTIFSIIGTLQLFNEFSVFNVGQLTAVDTSITPNYYAWHQAFDLQHFNYAATISFALAIVTFLFSVIFLTLAGRGGR